MNTRSSPLARRAPRLRDAPWLNSCAGISCTTAPRARASSTLPSVEPESITTTSTSSSSACAAMPSRQRPRSSPPSFTGITTGSTRRHDRDCRYAGAAMAEPAISVVIVAYRQRELLAECLQSCVRAAAEVPGGTELIVVDNGGLAPFIREGWPSVRLIEPGENVGFAGGVQRGVAAASGEWVALLNDDARIEPVALARLLAAGARDERIGSVAAQVRFHSDPAR